MYPIHHVYHLEQKAIVQTKNSFTYDLTMEDTTIIINALHYYKKIEKRGNFQQYSNEQIDEIRNKIVDQMMQRSKDIKNK